MEKAWNGLPFKPISEHYKNIFKEKVYKIPLAVADTCPNRMGLKGMQTCIFCDEWGSAAREESFELSLSNQIESFHSLLQRKYHARLFLAYFQAYTNTFMKLEKLKSEFQVALSFDFIKGIILGTRPDCLSKGVFDLWNQMTETHYFGVEFGVQSFFDDDLLFYKRGHDSKTSIQSILKTSRETKVDIGIHLIFGSPYETNERIIETAQRCNDLPISSVKLHHLHVLKNTPLETLYIEKKFEPISFEKYAERVDLFLSHLSPRFYVHRLAAYSSRWNDLISPSWTSDKMKTHQGIIDFIRDKNNFQSKYYFATNESERELQNQLKIQSQKRD